MVVDHVSEVQQVGSALWSHRVWWAQAPFLHHRVDWEAQAPAASVFLRSLDDDGIEALASGEMAVPVELRQVHAVASELAVVPELQAQAVPELPPLWHRGVKGRKLGQVKAFLGTVGGQLQQEPGPVVEWCSGMGHLGRIAAWSHGRRGVLLEKDPSLCRAYGMPIGAEPDEPVEHRCVDVLADDVHHMLPKGASILGLHACGRLSDRLAQVGHEGGARLLAFSPCCSHRRFSKEPWQAMSEAGRRSGIELDESALRLSVLDQGISPRRAIERRRRERVYRIAIDLLARQATGIDAYRGFRSVPAPWADLSLGTFVERVRALHDLPVPAVWSEEATLRSAQALDRELRALGVVRGWFRRPLERFLVQDRAAWLQEQGWQVRMGTFCDGSLTPRNLMVVARRP